MAWSSTRQEKRNKEAIELTNALFNTILEEKHNLDPSKQGTAFSDIQFTEEQSIKILDFINNGGNLDPLSAETYLSSNELAAFNSNPEIVRALRVACEFVRAGETISYGMETNQHLAIQLSNSKFYNKLVKRTGQVHLAASAAMTFFSIKTIWQVYASETKGSLSAKISALANTMERVGDFGGDIFETLTEWRLVSDSGWLNGKKTAAIVKFLHIVFSTAEIIGKGIEHFRYVFDEHAPLYMKITSTASFVLDSGGLMGNALATQAAVARVEQVQQELIKKAAEKLGKPLDKGDNILKILTKGEITDITKKFPIKNTIKGGLIGAQIAFLAADVITGVSSLVALNQYQNNLLKEASENPNQDHYRILTNFYNDRFAADAGFFIGKTAVDVLFITTSTALMLTGAGIPIALAVNFVGAIVSSVLSYAQQHEIESLALKRMEEIKKWEKDHPGENYFNQIFEDRYLRLSPLIQQQAITLLAKNRADRAFVLTQLYTTKQINEAVGLFYNNKDGSSSDRLFVGEYNKDGSLKEKAKEHITVDQITGTIKIKVSNDKNQLFYVSPNPILLPGEVKWKKVTGEESFWKDVKKTWREIKQWLNENVFNKDDKKKLGVGTVVGAKDTNGEDYFFEDKENEHLCIEPKDWDIDLGGDSSVVDLTQFTTRIVRNRIETFQQYDPIITAIPMGPANVVSRYVTKQRVIKETKTISIKVKSGDRDNQFLLGTGSHNIDAGGGSNKVSYSSINEQSSIRIRKDPVSGLIIVEKLINGLVNEESVGKQQIFLGSTKYNTQYRAITLQEVKNWATKDHLKNISSFCLGQGISQLDITSSHSLHIELIGHTNDIKLGNGDDTVIIKTNPNLKKDDNRKNHIRTRGGQDHIVITLTHAQQIEYYNENFICGGTDLDSQGKPIPRQRRDILEYAITGDYAKYTSLDALVRSEGRMLRGDIKIGRLGFMSSQYGARASEQGTSVTYKGEKLVALVSQYGVKVSWHDRDSLNTTDSFYNDLIRSLSDDEGYFKIERYAPNLGVSSDNKTKLGTGLPRKIHVGTDYAIHIEDLRLTNDDDEVNIHTGSKNIALNMHLGDGDDKVNITGRGLYTIHTGKGSKKINLGTGGINTVFHYIDELEDSIKATSGVNWLSFENDSTFKNNERIISSHVNTPYVSKLGVQIDLKAGKVINFLGSNSIQALNHSNKDFGSNLINLNDETKASLLLRPGDIADTILGFHNIMGTPLNDTILGTSGNDTIKTGDGDDRVNAREGDDNITTGAGRDIAYGGSGDDVFVMTYDNEEDHYYGGSGSNCLDASKADIPSNIAKDRGGLHIDLEKGIAYLADEKNHDRIREIQHAIGTDYKYDTFKGNSEANYFYGREGINLYEGRGGNDHFYGGFDQDIYVFGKGHGHDEIDDTGGDKDTIRLNAIINLNQSFLEKSGNDLLIKLKIDNQSSSIRVKNQFDLSQPNRGIEYIQLADGNTYNMGSILSSASWGSLNSHSFNSLNFNSNDLQSRMTSPTSQSWS